MPIYEYECNKCGDLFEIFTALIGEITFRVPCKCGGEGQRIMSLTSPPQFNGPGFHATDYKGVK